MTEKRQTLLKGCIVLDHVTCQDIIIAHFNEYQDGCEFVKAMSPELTARIAAHCLRKKRLLAIFLQNASGQIFVKKHDMQPAKFTSPAVLLCDATQLERIMQAFNFPNNERVRRRLQDYTGSVDLTSDALENNQEKEAILQNHEMV